MGEKGKGEGTRGVVAGRVEELRGLEAAERGLADAFDAYARGAESDGRLLHLAERHRQLAALLAERIGALGSTPLAEPSDQWIVGPPDRRETILYAELSAQRTYHDHLLDMDPETLQLLRDRVLPAHEETLALLTAESLFRQPDAST